MIWVLAAVDAAAGLYLLVHAYGREQRDKPGVLVVGIVLLLCAVTLADLGASIAAERNQEAPEPGTPLRTAEV